MLNRAKPTLENQDWGRGWSL